LLPVQSLSLALPPCPSPYDACAARLTTYATEGSGFYDPGSGEVPLYDDLVPAPSMDYENTLDTMSFPLCECDSNTTCSLEDADRTISLDHQIHLAFCQPVKERSTCSSSRGVIRVMGQTDLDHTDSPVSISKALLFCTCAAGYKRLPVSTWESSNLAFPYKCQ
ncbi:hypothetical protein PENTCL1PPCAC_22894, partial [Pristionchus entomophagus]